MTLEERKSMIDQKAKREEEKAIAEKEKHEKEYENYIKRIKALRGRIKDVIELAMYAVNKGINLQRTSYGCSESYENGMFFSNGWSHLVGIIDKDHLGIRNGGAYGDIDFYTDGEEVYGYDTRKMEVVKPRLRDMYYFLRDFDRFEKCLYEYIEKACK